MVAISEMVNKIRNPPEFSREATLRQDLFRDILAALSAPSGKGSVLQSVGHRCTSSAASTHPKDMAETRSVNNGEPSKMEQNTCDMSELSSVVN
jgi:hypothetical protein